MTKTYIISALVEHKPGVLYKISNMFWRRGFNIESVAIGTAEQEDLARITITIEGEEKDAEQFVGQLEKLIDVLKATRLDPKKAVIRELALVKLKAKDAKLRSDIFHYVDVFRGRIKRWQHWRFLSYINNLLTAGVAVCKDEKNRRFVQYKPTGRILKIWWAKQKNMKKKAIAQKIAEKTHTSMKEILKNFEFMQIIFNKNKEMANRMIEQFDLNKEEIAWLKKT